MPGNQVPSYPLFLSFLYFSFLLFCDGGVFPCSTGKTDIFGGETSPSAVGMAFVMIHWMKWKLKCFYFIIGYLDVSVATWTKTQNKLKSENKPKSSLSLHTPLEGAVSCRNSNHFPPVDFHEGATECFSYIRKWKTVWIQTLVDYCKLTLISQAEFWASEKKILDALWIILFKNLRCPYLRHFGNKSFGRWTTSYHFSAVI